MIVILLIIIIVLLIPGAWSAIKFVIALMLAFVWYMSCHMSMNLDLNDPDVKKAQQTINEENRRDSLANLK